MTKYKLAFAFKSTPSHVLFVNLDHRNRNLCSCKSHLYELFSSDLMIREMSINAKLDHDCFSRFYRQNLTKGHPKASYPT